MKKKVVIVDYQLGNLFSVQQACRHCGVDAVIASDADMIHSADAVILPGVGAFPRAMENIRTLHLDQALVEFIKSGRPIMGICLGLQLLFTESEEFGLHQGLDIISGKIRKLSCLDAETKIKVPHIGWSRVYASTINWELTPLIDLRSGTYQYFVHSFFAEPTNPNLVLTTTTYQGFSYCSSILKDNIFACQFHPEKSGKIGLKIYSNWLNS